MLWFALFLGWALRWRRVSFARRFAATLTAWAFFCTVAAVAIATITSGHIQNVGAQIARWAAGINLACVLICRLRLRAGRFWSKRRRLLSWRWWYRWTANATVYTGLSLCGFVWTILWWWLLLVWIRWCRSRGLVKCNRMNLVSRSECSIRLGNWEDETLTSGISEADSASFSGDDDGSLDSTPWLTGL